MSLKEDISKWVMLSVMNYFTTNIDSSLHVFVEGTERNTDQEGDWAEIRITNLNIGEVSKNTYSIEFTVDILVASHIDYSNPILQVTNVGLVNAHFSDIDLYKYGDDESLLGCMKLTPHTNAGDRVKITNMGQIDPSLDLLQSNIIGDYKIII